MVKREVFSKIGLLDEAFSPGMGEDGDFCIKAELAGYALVRVPRDGEDEFGKGVSNQEFPIFHRGSGTFGDKDYSEVNRRNRALLAERHGAKKGADRIEEIYSVCLNHPSDTNALFPILRKYASECRHITEFGVRGVFSTWAFLAARPAKYVGYDIARSAGIDEAAAEAKKAGIDHQFIQKDVLEADIEETDLLFVDTLHTYRQLKAELERHAGRVRKYLLVHDTVSFGEHGEDGGPGEMRAIREFLGQHPEWGVRQHLEESNGLTVLARGAGAGAPLPENRVVTSIVVPTCGKDWRNVLGRCLDAVFAHTDMSDKEVVVVANGAPGEALDYLKTRPVRVLEFPDRIGYVRAVNAGIASAGGKYVLLLDDDSFLQPQPKGQWMEILAKPFVEDPTTAAAGPFGNDYPDLGEVLHSGCTLYKKSALLKVGLFDEVYNPGYLSDEDVSIRLRKAGHRIVRVPEGEPPAYVDGFFQVRFPVVHTGTVHTMDKDGADRPLVERNRRIILERHGPKPGEAADAGGALEDARFIAVLGSTPRPRVSIIIPTYKDNWRTEERTGERINLLRQNLRTLAVHTDLAVRNAEVVVVCNGCRDGQEEHVKSLGPPFRAVSFPDALGYTRATNEGIKAAEGDYLVLLNDDVEMLPQPRSQWLDWLMEPFLADPRMGVTGPLQLHDDYSDQDVIIGFCLCTRRAVLRDVMAHTGGLLDEAYSPGGGEDIDLCCRARAAGYVVRQVPREGKLGFSHTNTGEFAIWHVNNQTFKDIPEYTRWYVKRNGALNMRRHNKGVRLNLGSGGVVVKGYLSLDLHDQRADIIGDATRLDLDDGSCRDILASHLLEHISPHKADDALREWFRVLRPGGRLVMEMPDIEDLCLRFTRTTDFNERWGILNAIYAPVNTTAEGAPTDITSPHLYGYWKADLADRLARIGFVDVSFGPEQFPHPYPPNLHVEATKPASAATSAPKKSGTRKGLTKPMKDLWKPPQDRQVPFGSDESYRKAMDFLCGCDKVEDWGAGTGYARRFLKEGVYIGVDGSRHPEVSVHAELAEYRSQTEGLLMRHVLEHCPDWGLILDNAIASFTRRMALVVSTPINNAPTRVIATNWNDIPDISFNKEDLVGRLKGLRFSEETIKTGGVYPEEHLFYIQK